MDTLMNGPREHCPLTFAVKVISGKWKLFILHSLIDGKKRYSEIRKISDNLTEKMLTKQLRELEGDGIIHRKVYAQVPPKVEYSLTELGEKLCFLFDPLYEWGIEYIRKMKPDQMHLLTNNEKH